MEKVKKPALGPERLTFPNVPPFVTNHEFLTSVAQLQRLQIPEYPKDIARQDPYMQLISTNRVFEKTTHLLEKKREYAKLARVHLARQWEDLQEKEETFRDLFVKMSDFVQSNVEKRRRALIRREEDHAIFLERVKDIEKLREVKDFTEKSKQELEQNINTLKIYEKFLNQVVAAGDEFKNADDLLGRYETLMETRNILGEKQNAGLLELEAARGKMMKMTEENKLVLIGLNTILAGLRARYSTTLRNSIYWESVVNAIRDHMQARYKEISAVRQSTLNLYLMMSKRKGDVEKIDDDDLEKQLVFIKNMIRELIAMKGLQELASAHSEEVKK